MALIASMTLVTAFLLFASAIAQSFDPSISSATGENTCLWRSVFVYTADSSTYVVTNLGSTTLSPTPSFFPNASVSISTVHDISTVYEANQTITTAVPASTVTIYRQPSASSASTGSIVAEDGFESGTSNPFSPSASGSDVSAKIVQGGATELLQPYSGDNYL